MIYILPIATVALCIVGLFLMIRDVRVNKTLFQSEETIQTNEKMFSKATIIYCVSMFVITIGASFLFCTLYKDNGVLMSMKRLALLSMMWPIAYIDLKTYRIPNSFIILGLIYRMIILAFELLFDSQYVWITLLSEVIAAVALLLAAVLCTVCMRNGIGFGDMKLFIVMGLMLGLDGIWGAILLSLIVSFVIVVYLLIAKKKTRKDIIPFGPALAIGTYLSVCLSGM